MKYAIIGLGSYAQNHLKCFPSNPTLKLLSAFDVDLEKSKSISQTYGSKVASCVEDIVTDKEVEAVIISTPTGSHFGDIEACARNHKHVLVNIPVTTNLLEAIEILKLVKKHNIRFMAGHNTRKNPAIIKLKQLLQEGIVGKIHMAEAHVGTSRGYRLTPHEWRANKSSSPLLPFAQMGILFIDLYLYLLGAPREVFAFMSKRDGVGESPDLGLVIGKYADGLLTSLGCSYVTEAACSVAFIGDKGRLSWNLYDHNSLTIKNGKHFQREEYPLVNEQEQELLELADAVSKGSEIYANERDAYHVAAYYDSISTSIDTSTAARFKHFEG